jgi:hypothetical protein
MNRRLMALAAAAAALAGLAIHQYRDYLPRFDGGGEPGAPAADNVAASAGAPVVLNPLEGLDAKSYASILEHPLFNPGRKPRPPEAPPQPTEAPEPPPQPPEQPPLPPPAPAGPNAGDFRLLGIVAGPSERLAAVELIASSEVIYVREGDPAGEWTVIEIGDRSVKIGSEENAVTLNLFEDKEEEAPQDDQPAEEDQPEEAGPPPDSPVPMMPGVAPPPPEPDATLN